MKERRTMKAVYTDIQTKRQELIYYANVNGMTNVETVRLSQELDVLINEYLYMQQQQFILAKTLEGTGSAGMPGTENMDWTGTAEKVFA